MKKRAVSVALMFLATVAVAQSATPCGVQPTPGQPHVCLSWQASSTIGATYNVFRATKAGGENYSTPLNTTPLTSLYYYDTAVVVGTQYFYTVTAGTGGAMSAPSVEVSAQVPVPDGSPSTPSANAD